MKTILLCFVSLLSTPLLAQVNLEVYVLRHQQKEDSTIQSNIGKEYSLSKLTTLEGTAITSKDLAGKVTIINFWFKTCSPCIAEFDALNTLYKRFKDNARFQFISLCSDTPEETKESVKKYRLPYPVCSLPRDACYRLNFGLGFPTTIIIDKAGKIAFITTGGSIDKTIVSKEMAGIEEKIAELL